MNHYRLIWGSSFILSIILAPLAWSANPAGFGTTGGEFNIKISRVPSNEIAKAKSTTPPLGSTPEILAEGKKSFWDVEAALVIMGPKEKGMGQPQKTFPFNREISPTRSLTSIEHRVK